MAIKARTQQLKEKIPKLGLKMCLERARLYTESWKQTEGEPLIIRRAKAFAHYLKNMTIYIQEGELIVGNQASVPDLLPIYPEYNMPLIEERVKRGQIWIDESLKKEFFEIADYWRKRSFAGRGLAELGYDVKDIKKWTDTPERRVYYVECFDGERGIQPDFDASFQDGLNGVIKQAESKLKRLELTKQTELSLRPTREYPDKKHFYESVIIADKAAIAFARRYAELARSLAEEKVDPQRKRELEEIAEICENVPANAPRTLHEALQFFFFLHLMDKFLEYPGLGHSCRFDQLMYPCYQRDLKEGRLTREKALELLECLWIKLAELGRIRSTLSHEEIYESGKQGGTMLQNLTIGGVTEDGEDATNEFSYLMLDATKSIRTVQPTLSIRCHHKMPEEILRKAFDVVKTGMGMPAFFNDERFIPYFIITGSTSSWNQARNYRVAGCITPQLVGADEGKATVRFQKQGSNFNIVKCLEYALNNGADLITGEQVGPRTGDPEMFSSYEDVKEAFRRQVNYFLERSVYQQNLLNLVEKSILPRPFTSSVHNICMEKGVDAMSIDTKDFARLTGVGVITVADSLAAIKKSVFENKAVSMKELVNALRTNFEGREELRQMLINRAPKFGNDEDYVDFIARDIFKMVYNEIGKLKSYDGIRWRMGFVSHAIFVPMGKVTGATPDGRMNGDPIADGGVSPYLGRDKKGPTAVLKSVSKTDNAYYNQLLNQRLNLTYLRGDDGARNFVAYMKSFIDLGVWHVQFNTVDTKTLRDAQKHPEKYGDLIVRVAGYSAYFTQLSKELQDAIMARTEQAL